MDHTASSLTMIQVSSSPIPLATSTILEYRAHHNSAGMTYSNSAAKWATSKSQYGEAHQAAVFPFLKR
jgi:hypothetical protein